VALHRSIPINGLSEAQVCDIFSGKNTSWKEVAGIDAKIVVLTRKRDDANTRVFREKLACFKNLQITPDAIALLRGTEMFEALDKRDNTVGIINVDADIARAAKHTEKGVVTLGAPQGTAKRFLEYVASAEGHKILASHGTIPIK
jgi:phosphate transport system substrate-binding protein